MLPLYILLIIFFISLFLLRIIKKRSDIYLAGRIALSAMLLFTAVGHFAFTKGMQMMVPAFVPFKKELVLLTGIAEIIAAIALHIPRLRKITGWMLIIFFITVLPANIYASMHHVNYQNASYDGNGPEYLWIRIPLQLLFIFCTYFFLIRPSFNRRVS